MCKSSLLHTCILLLQQIEYAGLIERITSEGPDSEEENGAETEKDDELSFSVQYGITSLVDKKTVLQPGDKVCMSITSLLFMWTLLFYSWLYIVSVLLLSSSYQIERVKHLLDINAFLNAINALAFRKLYYCSSVWSSSTNRKINKLQHV